MLDGLFEVIELNLNKLGGVLLLNKACKWNVKLVKF